MSKQGNSFPIILIPVTIISFSVFTKWWFTVPVDAPDTMYWGFPFAFVGEGWHTSMSIQFFVMELIADLIFYFLFWYVCFRLLRKKLYNLGNKILQSITWTLAAIITIVAILIVIISNPVIHVKRTYEWQLISSGYQFIWQAKPRPELNQYQKLKVNK